MNKNWIKKDLTISCKHNKKYNKKEVLNLNITVKYKRHTVCFMLVRTEGGWMLLRQQLLHENWWILKHLETTITTQVTADTLPYISRNYHYCTVKSSSSQYNSIQDFSCPLNITLTNTRNSNYKTTTVHVLGSQWIVMKMKDEKEEFK